jgi:hypothetical protein
MKPQFTARVALIAGLALLQAPASAATYWSGNSAGYHLDWADSDIRVTQGGKAVYALSAEVLTKYREFPEADVAAEIAPASWVGPLLTVKVAEYAFTPGTAHPSMVTYFKTVDLRQPAKPFHLTDWVTEGDLWQALVNDGVVKKALTVLKWPPVATLPLLLKHLPDYTDDCRFAFTSDFVDHVAFHHVQGPNVALRIGLSHGCEAARGTFTELGLYVPTTKALSGPLTEARNGKQGFLAEQAPQLAFRSGRHE